MMIIVSFCELVLREMNKRPNYHFLQYLLYKVDIQNGGTWASTINSKSMNLISTQKVYSVLKRQYVKVVLGNMTLN